MRNIRKILYPLDHQAMLLGRVKENQNIAYIGKKKKIILYAV